MSLQEKSGTETNHGKPSFHSLEYEPNPAVAPYQPANFMSSTILKKVPVTKPQLDNFGSYDYNYNGRRGVMLHTDRYQVDFIKSFHGLTQRERLEAGLNYVEAMRGTKRRRELVLHRSQLDLIMGGKQIEFEERFYITRELQKLKALAMPDVAKDLYHGRGIQLPTNHNSLKPRNPMPTDADDEDNEAMVSAPSSLHTVLRENNGQHQFPRIDRNPTFFGKGTQLRTRSTLNHHPQLPSIRSRVEKGLNRDVTSLSRSHSQAPPPSRDSSQDQSQRFLFQVSKQRKSNAKHLPVSKPAQSVHEKDHKHLKIDGVISNTPTDEGLNKTMSNPLMTANLIDAVPKSEREELCQKFQKLDTDKDGHIQYNQLKTQLPKALNPQQERFIKEVYNMTNSVTLFGVDEFMAMDRLSKTVEALSGRAKSAFETVDFESIEDKLLQYMDKFGTADIGNHNTITIEILQKILSETVTPSLVTNPDLWDEVLELINVDYGTKITKIGFIAHIPLFISLEKEYQ